MKTKYTLASIALVLIGCGGTSTTESSNDGSGHSSSNFDSGLSENKPLNELSAAEVDQVCFSMGELVVNTTPTDRLCRNAGTSAGVDLYSGYGEGSVAERCQETTDECLANPAVARASLSEAWQCPTSTFSQCTASVGHFEACFEDIITELHSYAEQNRPPACADLEPYLDAVSNGERQVEPLPHPSEVPSCVGIEDACFN